jgi:hypothetical protein
VGFVNNLERRFGWISFPGLLRGIVILQFFTFFLIAILDQGEGEVLTLLVFDWRSILSGEVWRLISFVFIPVILPSGTLSFVFIFFVLFIGFLFADTLENSWGVFRASIFVYATIILQIAANILFHKYLHLIPLAMGGALLYQSLFFAFATLFPRYEFRLMLLFPIQVWILALINAALLGLTILGSIATGAFQTPLYLLLGFAPYLAWAVPMLVNHLRTRATTRQRQASFQARQRPADEAFHTCASCGATEHSHPDREFRMTEQDEELCSACLDEQP